MDKIIFQSVDDYVDAQSPSARDALMRVRAAILTAVPDAEESISYNMPRTSWKANG